MINFQFHNPTKVIFGKNVESEAGVVGHAMFIRLILHALHNLQYAYLMFLKTSTI